MSPMLDPLHITGRLADGRFHVEAVAGAGGFGVVYRAWDTRLARTAALKCLVPRGRVDRDVAESLRTRFLREARLHAHLADCAPAFVRSFATGSLESALGSVPYSALEWLEGEPLGRELRMRRKAGKPGRPLQLVIERLDGVAQALAFAHAHGIAHRDLKPDNLFVAHSPDGPLLKILDLGSAKESSALAGRGATSDLRMLTLGYAAPEQLNPNLGRTGAWTDVYTFALVLLEMVTGRRARAREDLGGAMDPERCPSSARCGAELHPLVQATIDRALVLAPDRRTPDLGVFWGEIKNAVARCGPPEPWPSRAPTVTHPCSSDDHDITTRLDVSVEVEVAEPTVRVSA